MADNDDNDELAIRHRIKTAMKAHRLSKGWSQRIMAEYVGATLKNYEKYEDLKDMKRGVPISIIARFCEFSGTDINWILYGRKPRKAVSA